jgi:hypothetical protein
VLLLLFQPSLLNFNTVLYCTVLYGVDADADADADVDVDADADADAGYG